jgi:hypothetical protein
MSAASALSGDIPPAAGGAVPAGRRLLGLVHRIGETGMALARGIGLIARQRLHGQDIRRMAPPGFSATHAHFLVVQAVAWTAALRERLLGLPAVRPSFTVATGLPKAQRAPQGHGAAHYLPDAVPNPTEDDWHDWRELAKPVRIGPAAVAAAMRQIAEKSNDEVVTGVCDKLSRALVDFGAGADVAGLEAMAAEARALLPEVEAPERGAADRPADAEGAPGVVAAKVPPEAPGTEAASPSDEPASAADDDRPPKPPDG